MTSRTILWLKMFGFVIYRIIKIKVDVNPGEENQGHRNHWDESESESEENESSDDETSSKPDKLAKKKARAKGDDFENKRKGETSSGPTIDETISRRKRTRVFEVPVEAPFNILQQAQVVYEYGKGRVVVLDRNRQEDTRYHWEGQLPDQHTMRFRSDGNALLYMFREMNRRKLYYSHVMAQKAIPPLYLQPSAQTELETSVQLHSKLANGYTLQESEGGTLEIVQQGSHVQQLNSTGELHDKLLTKRRLIERKDNVVYLPAGYQSVTSVVEPVYIGDVRKEEEDWCRIVSALSGIPFEFLYPQITGSGKLIAGDEQMHIMIGNVQLFSQQLASVMKNIWCEVYVDDKLEELMWSISISSPLAMENILTLFDRGALDKDQALEELYKTHHMDVEAIKDRDLSLQRQHELNGIETKRDHDFKSELHTKTLDSKLKHEKLKIKHNEKTKTKEKKESSSESDSSDSEEEKKPKKKKTK
jgi:hypothetical protein